MFTAKYSVRIVISWAQIWHFNLNDFVLYCAVILLDGSVPIKYGLRLNSDSKYIDLKNELTKLCGLNSDVMLVCELTGSQIKSIIADDQKVKITGPSDLYIYEVPRGYERPRTNSELGVIIEQGLKDIQRNPGE